MSSAEKTDRFRVDVYQHGAVTVASPEGAVTQDHVAEFRARIDEIVASSAGRVALDCTRLAYVDSKGLEALVDLSEKLDELGHALRLIAANATLRETFLITDTGKLFENFEDVNAAARSLL